MRTQKIYCPANGWDCPYYKNGECAIEDPMNECDDFGAFWDEDDDYCADEERTAFEDDGEPADIDDDCGYDPYMGCFTDDC